MQNRSGYYKTLDAIARERYDAKLLKLRLTCDPYLMGKNHFELTDDVQSWPEIQYPDIYNYLIDYPSQFTKERLKAYKSLDSYKYVTAGLVSNVFCKQLEDNTDKFDNLCRLKPTTTKNFFLCPRFDMVKVCLVKPLIDAGWLVIV